MALREFIMIVRNETNREAPKEKKKQQLE